MYSQTKATYRLSKISLEQAKVAVTVRREMGRDIDGACGQLRRKHLTSQEEE